MPRLQMDLLQATNLNQNRTEMLSQKSPSPRQPCMQGADFSPERDGGHTERTHANKGRTLRFNLHECDY